MIALMQPTVTEEEYILLACLVLRSCGTSGLPVDPDALRAAHSFNLPTPDLEALVRKLIPGMQAILTRRGNDCAA